jgi:HAD superfamily hydrolase (TIGR01509 family)
MITTLVFDMDGVLCRYRIERRLALLSGWSGQPPEAIRAAIFTSGFEEEAERGTLSADEYLRGFGERIGYPLTAAQWVEATHAAMEPDEEVLALVRQLSATHTVAMFTNNPLLLKRHLGEVFPAVLDLFGERALVAAEVGARKPDPEAFRRLAVRLEREPGEMLFIDDKATNVAGARDAGLHATQASGAGEVRAAIAESPRERPDPSA